jgi:aminoglycoside phosphotransferase (APT) family kinase protein
MEPLGEGLDNIAFERDGMVVRTRRADPASVAREAELLRLVAAVSPLPVPVPVEVDPALGRMTYRKLPGVPLLDLPLPDLALPDLPLRATEAVGAELGRFLAALHAVPVERVAGLVEVDDTAPAEWLDEAAAAWPVVAAHLPASFLPARPPGAAPGFVFSHMDLGIEHVLVDPATGAVTGIIDWTDAAVGDPAYDLGLILRDLGPAALDAALAALGRDDAALRDRAVFHARCALVEDLAYGLANDRPGYVRKSVAAATRHFPW